MAAQGTLVLFDEFSEAIGDGRIDLDTASFYIALSTIAAGVGVMQASNAIPTWGVGGTTNVSVGECTAGGGYTTGGELLAGVTWGQTAGTATFNATDVVWTSSASSPEDIKTAVIYCNSGNKDCIGYFEMTGDSGTTAISLLAGDVTVAFHASGILSIG